MSRRRRKKQTKQSRHSSSPSSPECAIAISPFSEVELDFFRRGDEPHAPIHEVTDEPSITNA
jgi:hypothetical protein